MKYMTAMRALTGRILKVTEILPVNVVDRLYLLAAVTGDKWSGLGGIEN